MSETFQTECNRLAVTMASLQNRTTAVLAILFIFTFSATLSFAPIRNVHAQDPFGTGGVGAAPTNVRLFLSSEQLRSWLAQPVTADFQETFTLQGKSHPARGTSSTTATIAATDGRQDDHLRLELNSQVSTRLLPQTPIGRIYVDAKSNVRSGLDVLLLNNRLIVDSGCPTICSKIVGDGICANTTGKVGLRLKRKLIGAVVESKNDDILQRLNEKITKNLKTQLDQEANQAVSQVNQSLQKLHADLAKNGVNCLFHTRSSASGLMFGASLSSNKTVSKSVPILSDFKTPGGCWVAFHESAINNLQPILDNQTVDAEAFRKMWAERFFLGKPLGQTAREALPGLSKIGEGQVAKSVKVAFAKPAVTTQFVEDNLLLSMRIAALMNQATVMELEPPLVVDAIYDITNQDGNMRLRLDESSLKDIELERRNLLEQFLPSVVDYTGDQLESVLATELGIKLGRPAADSGWLVVPFSAIPQNPPQRK